MMLKWIIAATLSLATLQAQEIDIVKFSEAFGHLIGRNLSASGITLDLDAIVRGMQAAQMGAESPMSEADYQEALNFIQKQKFEEIASENLETAKTFLAENMNHANVIEMEEGKLQYRIEQEGQGEAVQEHTTPLVHYTGRYTDGQVFGSSVDGDPINLPLDQAIPGFALGVVGMKEGERRTIFVHPELGYGKSGHLPPNSLLVFEVEVIRASDPKEPADSPEHG